jgi:hypothetical protein
MIWLVIAATAAVGAILVGGLGMALVTTSRQADERAEVTARDAREAWSRQPRVWEGEHRVTSAPDHKPLKAWTPEEADALGVTDTYLLIDRIERELRPPHVCSDDCEVEEVRSGNGSLIRSMHTRKVYTPPPLDKRRRQRDNEKRSEFDKQDTINGGRVFG